MRKIALLAFCFLCISIQYQLRAQSCGVSAVYGGGPFYLHDTVTIPEIRASGFTTAVIWTIHINTSGDLNFNDEFLAVSNGQYVGGTVHPAFPTNMALLKTSPTSVKRIEFGLSASGSPTFANIKTLIAAQGTGTTSILYKNFKALKDSIPVVDAINFDDESTYNVASSVQFAVMLADLGYKVTLCPYTSSSYWTSVATQTNTQRPGTIDAIFLQCYSGGAFNSPCSGWNFSGIPVYPGLWDSNKTPLQVRTKIASWKTQCNINGGFMWLYDDFYGTSLTSQYANAIDSAIGIGSPSSALNAYPLNNSTNLSNTDTLRWSGLCAQSRDVYFGTSNPPPFITNQTDTNFVTGVLINNTTYYWRINEKNYFGTTIGTIWSFTTLNDVGVNNISSKSNIINCYPTPAKDYLTIETTNSNTEQRIEIDNLFGQTLYTSSLYQKVTVNTSAFASGVYIIKLYTDKETIVRKFIKD